MEHRVKQLEVSSRQFGDVRYEMWDLGIEELRDLGI
jgi:hypothetical protein